VIGGLKIDELFWEGEEIRKKTRKLLPVLDALVEVLAVDGDNPEFSEALRIVEPRGEEEGNNCT